MRPSLTTADAVIATLQYFESALTPGEIFRLLPSSCELQRLGTTLADLLAQGRIQRYNGWYALRGSVNLQQRAERYNSSLSKWWIARRSIRWIRWVPFVRMVAITNTLALNMADPASDIDVLVVGSSGRLWTVRWLVTATLQILGCRRHGAQIANRICLSFYLSDRALDLSRFFAVPDDLHYAYWVAMTTVLFEARGAATAKQFEQSNDWIRSYFPQQYWAAITPVFAVRDSQLTQAFRETLEWVLRGAIGDWLEKVLRWIQRKKIFSHRDSRVHRQGVDVVVSDDVLKFHESDSRGQHRRQWVEACRLHGIPVSDYHA